MVYLQDIRLTNFKCFEETKDLKFGKITLLTGANSTGKSSLMYGILSALQSENFPMELSANGGYVQMGNFLEMVLKHDTRKTIGIGFTLKNDSDSLRVSTSWKVNYAGNPILDEYVCESSYYNVRLWNDGGGRQRLDLKFMPDRNPRRGDMKSLLNYVKNKTPQDADMIKFLKSVNEETDIINVDLNALSEKSSIRYSFMYVMQEIMDRIREYNRGVNYISSYRQPAKRVYTEEPVASGKIATSGEGFINELLKWKDDNHDKFSDFVEGMKSVGLLNEVVPSRLEAGQFKIGIRVHEGDEMVNLWDVGFGISQTMPIIIGDVELGNGSTLYVSQPEVHLHPRAQANLGDYLVKQVHEGKRYVIESHSEYLMNRLRLSIVKGGIAEDDVMVYYMSQKEGKTSIDEIKFTKSGQIEGAPKDFFDTYMIDVMDIAMSAQ